ncbi:hypothetical protein AWJ20_2817 [Sugiyamaella lignohabitans]|uniref:Asteroid domain-containing protein n=1 Tax=Sugiyamaella lignohabitans TaxID=796027 RepID=A0A167FED7_9ASCO|nr:uncharacterized protein AWJ20_2817 [Sugiyamaella lignohabitans]ANB15193.1 hypothetical protein AWJ20_2817 [Sugiyamaella lignohabitans]
MGIWGLTRDVQGYARKIDDDFFRDSEIYIDGPSLAHIMGDAQDSISIASFERLIQDATGLLEDIKKLKPKSIQIVFDGTLPLEKLETRVGRRRSQFNNRKEKHIFAVSTILYVVLKEKHPNVDVSIAAEEADDALVSIIASSTSSNRKIIFTNDSDFYTFIYPGDVEVLSYPRYGPYYNQDNRLIIPDRAINVKSCREVATRTLRFATGKPLRTPSPTYRESQMEKGFTFLNPMHEFVNIYDQTGKFMSFLPVLTKTRNSSAPWTITVMYRSYAYSLMIRQYCKLHDKPLPPAGTKVKEYLQDLEFYVARDVPILLDELPSTDKLYYDYKGELDDTFKDNDTIASLVLDDIKTTVEQRKIDKKLLESAILKALDKDIQDVVSVPPEVMGEIHGSLYSRLMAELMVNKTTTIGASKIGYAMWRFKSGRLTDNKDTLAQEMSKLAL